VSFRQRIVRIPQRIDSQNVIVHMNYVIEGSGALVNEKGEETPLKAGDFALVNPDEKHQYRNKGDVPFKMICGVPKEFE
jgi:quercetin dioxygenase-like cupin family protein